MDFFQFKDGIDFMRKTGLSHDDAIDFLDKELKIRMEVDNRIRTNYQGDMYRH
jgi:hypothetical protein